MSNVRLSNGSPTLERTEPRVAETPKPSACRNLFGSVNHEELKKDLNAHFRELEESASAKWGFDFASDTPLTHGQLEWELVDARKLPGFYSRLPRGDRRAACAGRTDVDLNGNHSCVVLVPTPHASTECTEQCGGLRKRPACHDSSAPSKKSLNSPDEVSCPARSQSAEHTPRKTSPKRPT